MKKISLVEQKRYVRNAAIRFSIGIRHEDLKIIVKFFADGLNIKVFALKRRKKIIVVVFNYSYYEFLVYHIIHK